MLLNHPQTNTPNMIHGKNVFHKTGPWCQKGWRPLYYWTWNIGGHWNLS